jgi:dTDP-4-dehydrorhamnose reductase
LRILVTGSAGMLGRALLAAGAAEHQVTGVDLVDGDLTTPGVAAALLTRHEPEWVLHAAAYTDVDGAERERERALAVNGEATARLAAACADRSVGLAYVSTDYVFSGDDDGYDEDAVRRPINLYGLSKARGEEAVEGLATPWQIVRTSWLFGDAERNFVLTIRRLLRERDEIRVVADQVGCPTFAPDLAGTMLWLAARRLGGIFHVTNRGTCSWYEFAREIARLSGADPEKVRPCTTAEFPRPARRPPCSVLRSRRLEVLGHDPLPTWQDGLLRYLRSLPVVSGE